MCFIWNHASKEESCCPYTVCSICENEIIDASEKCVGEDSIKCEGLCKVWLHRKCASMSKSAFEAAKLSSVPFLCLHCRLAVQQGGIRSLKDSVDNLLSRVVALESKKLFESEKKQEQNLVQDQIPMPPLSVLELKVVFLLVLLLLALEIKVMWRVDHYTMHVCLLLLTGVRSSVLVTRNLRSSRITRADRQNDFFEKCLQ